MSHDQLSARSQELLYTAVLHNCLKIHTIVQHTVALYSVYCTVYNRQNTSVQGERSHVTWL